jgi:hypothetical protein
VQNPQGLHAFCKAKRRASLLACQPCVSCTEPLPCIKMKKTYYILLSLIILISCHSKTESTELQNGDIIFQTSKSGQSKAIQLATGSKYSHMGIVYKQGNDFFVYEAVQPVKLTPLKDWIKRGENGHYVVKCQHRFIFSGFHRFKISAFSC